MGADRSSQVEFGPWNRAAWELLDTARSGGLKRLGNLGENEKNR
jgi:hypothetical protein